MRYDASQIDKLLAGYVRANNFTANGPDDVATAAITTVLATAGDLGVQVPLQVPSTSYPYTPGVVTTGGNNRVEIYSNVTKQKLTESGGEIYGRLTESGGVYTLTYYYLNPTTGTETAYTFAANTAIDFEFIYKFTFETAPYDIFVASKSRNVNEEGANVGRTYTEKLTVSGLNTVANLAFTPDQNYNISLIVNGKMETTQDSGPPFSVAGKVITWSANNAGYNLKTTFNVIARYTTLQ